MFNHFKLLIAAIAGAGLIGGRCVGIYRKLTGAAFGYTPLLLIVVGYVAFVVAQALVTIDTLDDPE